LAGVSESPTVTRFALGKDLQSKALRPIRRFSVEAPGQ
jgi:hypothetical protein